MMLSSKAKLPKKVKLVEVGPRDGLQNESVVISTESKIEFIHQLVNAGVQHIEAGSFVNAVKVPQMADSASVFKGIQRSPGVIYSALTPNLKGFEQALEADVREVAVFTAASEAFNQKNINCSIEESIARFKPLIAAAQANNIAVRGYVSCVAGCPYSGHVAAAKVAEVAQRLIALGCYEISLGDTTGMGTPGKIMSMLTAVANTVGIEQLAVHFHDSYGQALVNIYAALEMGIAVIDASVAGLGGCPYAPGANGNVASEDVVYMLDGLGIDSNINLEKLIAAGNSISSLLMRKNQSKAASALTAKLAPGDRL
jgi:hydroxymethylglutaryl-CoA lyase